MKKNITRLFLAILLLGTATATFAQQTYYYDFRNNFNENSGSGPVLNVLGTGAFTDVPLPELSCLSRTVYGFTQNSGVQFDNTAAGNFVTETYSVEMYFEFLNNSGFKRIIDFKNQTSDFGLYCTAGELQFYDGITIPTTAFVANQYVHLVVTRDSASEEVNLYVDGALLGTFVDSTQLGVLDASNLMNFFQDDLVFGGEARPGNIALLKIYNTAIDGTTVTANFNDLEKTSAAIAFTPDITSACLNGNVFNFTNNSTTTSTVTYNWTFGDGGVATTNNATYNYTTSGNFTVTLTADDGAGCIDSVSASVTLFDNPVVNLGADTTFCDGFVLTLNAGDGFSSYIWQDGTTDSTYVVTTGGQYSVLVTDDNNCTAVDEINIVVAALPVIELGSDTTLCFGSSLPLSGPAGMGSYLWSTGETTELILVNASETYFLTVVDFGGCTNTDSIVVDILPELVISLGADTTFCAGDSLILDPGASFQSYLWNDGSTNSTFTVAASGTYSVSVLTDIGCAATDTINVQVDAIPVVALGQDTTLCFGSTYQLVAPAGLPNYLWSTGEVTDTITVTTSGIYAVIASTLAGCSATDTVDIIINPELLISLGNDSAYCEGTQVILNPGAGFTSYVWGDGSTDSTFSVTASGIYIVVVTDAFGCSATDTVAIQIDLIPVVDLGVDTTLCFGSTYQLTAPAGYPGYLWTTGEVTETIVVNTSGIYDVVVTTPAGCTAVDTVQVTINPELIISLGPDVTVCSAASTVLDPGTGFASYVWSDGSTDPTFTVTASGDYSVFVTDIFGCSATDTVSVIVNQSPVVSLGADTTFCGGTTIDFDAGAGFVSYLWSDGSSAQTLSVTAGGIYAVTVTGANGCTGTDEVIAIATPLISLGPDFAICDGQTASLDAGAGFTSYLWSDGALSQTINVTLAGTYTVTVSDASGCINSDDVVITVTPPPFLELGPDQTICFGTAVVLDAGAGNFNYLWNDGSTNQLYLASTAGVFSVTITDITSGCEATDNVTITVNPAPVITLGVDTTLCFGTTFTLDGGAGFSAYLWNDGTSAQTLDVTAAGLYTVTVTDAAGCTGSDDVEISYYPQIPTPSVSQVGNTLQSSSLTGNQWYAVPGGLIAGATGDTYSPPQNGVFYVVVTDSNGCSSAPSPDFNFINTGIGTVANALVTIAPNPANQYITIETSGVADSKVQVELIDILGKTVFETTINANSRKQLAVNTYPAGIYLLKTSAKGFNKVTRVVISR